MVSDSIFGGRSFNYLHPHATVAVFTYTHARQVATDRTEGTY